MKFTDSIRTDIPNKEEAALAVADWPACYYEEKNPAKRRALLNEAVSKNLSPEEDVYRSMLFDLRYSPSQYGEGGYADNYMRCFMDFNLLSKNRPSRFGMSKAKKNVLKDLKGMGLGADVDDEGLYNSILLSEFCHLGQSFIALCADSKQYRSVLFGFGKINDQALVRKLYNDLLSAGVTVAEMLDIYPEMELWIHGLDEARARMLPETASFFK